MDQRTVPQISDISRMQQKIDDQVKEIAALRALLDMVRTWAVNCPVTADRVKGI